MTKNLKIEQIFVFITIDDTDGSEGVAAFQPRPGEWMPMVCADWDRVQSLKPIAEEIAKRSGKAIKLVKFSNSEIIEEIK